MTNFTVKKIDEMDAMDGGEKLGKFRRARNELGISAFGVSVIDLHPNADQYPDHGHPDDGQEEIYTVLSGSGQIEIDGRQFPLDSSTMVRVGPGTKRKIWPDDGGMRVVPIGGRRGHGYEPPARAPDGEDPSVPISDDEMPEGDYAVKAIDEMEGPYRGAFKRARAELGAEAFGVQVLDLPPNTDGYPEHDHSEDGQEELYFALSGAAEIEIDGERHPLDPDTMARVGPGTTRKVWPGDDGIRLVIVGAVAGEPYEPPDITKLGEPDPMKS